MTAMISCYMLSQLETGPVIKIALLTTFEIKLLQFVLTKEERFSDLHLK